jgi:hypothetical protein
MGCGGANKHAADRRGSCLDDVFTNDEGMISKGERRMNIIHIVRKNGYMIRS